MENKSKRSVEEESQKIHTTDKFIQALMKLYVANLLLCMLIGWMFLTSKLALCMSVVTYPVLVTIWTMTTGVSVIAAMFFICVTVPWTMRVLILFLSYTPISLDTAKYTCPLPVPEKLDVILTWVNVTDTTWQEKARENKCNVDKYVSGAGDADPFETLKYTIRGIRKNMQFVNKIYITTEDQKISWLVEGDDIRIVPHSEFVDKQILPTFNSHPTEYSIHKIFDKGLTQYPCFLYMNDDFLVMKKTKISDFIDPETGKIIFYGYQHVDIPVGPGFVDLPVGFFKFPEGDDLRTLIDPHVPYIVNAHAMTDYMQECGAKCDTILNTKCTRTGRLWSNEHMRYLWKHNALQYISPIDSFLVRLGLGINFLNLQTNIDLIEFIEPKFVFIESHNSIENRQGALQMVLGFLQKHFPDKGSWEL
jgi:hypothetical protein